MSLLQMSFSGAIFIIAVVIIRAIAINKLPKKTFLVLWEIVLLRLLIPFSVPSVFSVYTFISNHSSAHTFFGTGTGNIISVMPQQNPVIAIQGAEQLSQNALSSVSVRFVVWFTGMILFAVFFTMSYLRCLREFQTSLPVRNEYAEQWLKKHPLKRQISIRQSDRISAPLTYGILHPVILMSKQTDWKNVKQLQYVLSHEYIHIYRFDTITKLIAAAALCIHWFNPMVWIMHILFNRDMELACDESVVRQFGETSKSVYAQMLIDMEIKKSGLLPFCNNFSKNAIEERITAIMKIRKTTIFSLIAACVIVLGTMTVFATSAHDKNDSQDVIVAETPGESVDYSVYEKYGLFHEQEKGYYTYQGNIVRFFNDPTAKASFTNFFNGTVDLEAEYDENNRLIGIKESSEEVYEMHTKRYENSGIASVPAGATVEAGNRIYNERVLKDYEPYGVTYHSENGAWYYDNQQIGGFIDYEKSIVYFDDSGSIYLMLSNNAQNEPEIKEISSQDAQEILQNNNP